MISFQLSNEHKTSSIPSGRNHETYSHIVAPKRCTKDSNYQYFQQDFTRHVYLSGNFSGKFNQVAKSIFTKFHLFVVYHYFLEAAIFKPIHPPHGVSLKGATSFGNKRAVLALKGWMLNNQTWAMNQDIWLVVSSRWKIWKSVGMIIPNMMET